jgi:hypothetical protein
MKNLEDHIRHAIKTKRVSVPESTIRWLPALPRYTDVFLLLCEDDSVNPRWNKKLLRLCLVEFLRRRKQVFAGYWPNLHEALRPFFTNKNLGDFRLFLLYTEVIIKLAKQAKINPYYADIDFGECIREFFAPEEVSNPHWFLLRLTSLASKEYLATLAKCKDDTDRQLFYEIVYPSIQGKKRTVKQQLKDEGDDLKREIVENVYHPRNVERWLETGGWELLEMMT